MYCGDETGSFVGDIGSHTSRFGYGGEDSPKYVTSSYVATKGEQKIIPSSPLRWTKPDDFQSPMRGARTESYDQPVADPNAYLQQGDSVQNWDAFEALWESAFDAMHVRDRNKHTSGGGNYLKKAKEPEIETSDGSKTAASGVTSSKIEASGLDNGKCVHPILVALPGCTHQVGHKDHISTHREQLIKATEIMMERLDCPAMFVAPQPMLASFAHGRQTSLVVDIGAGGTRVTPVVDGILLQQAQRRTGRGGDWLSNVCWQALSENRTILRPRYQLREMESAAKKCGIFHRWAMQDMLTELRSCTHVQLPTWSFDATMPFAKMEDEDDDDAMEVEGAAATTYELPDGTLVDLSSKVGKDICRLPELMFTDQVPFQDFTSATATTLPEEHTLSNLPLHKLIKESLGAVADVDARKELASNILLTGGCSLQPNLEERLSLEVSRSISGAFKPKVIASKHSVERSCASWIGGSILTSLGSFQQLWMSRAEYEEYGVNLAVQRFP